MKFRYKKMQVSNSPSNEFHFYKKLGAQWLSRLLEFELPIDDNFFGLAIWIYGSPEDFVRYLQKNMDLPGGKTAEEKRAIKAFRELGKSRMTHINSFLENLFDEQPLLRQRLVACIQTILNEAVRTPATLANPLKGLTRLFNLDKDAMQLCLYAFGVANFRPLEWYLEDQLELGRFANHRMLGAMLGLQTAQTREQLGLLRGLGIIDESDNLRLNDKLCEAIFNTTGRTTHAFFCQPLPKPAVPYELFRIAEDEKRHALDLLRQEGDAPAHILLYGAPGTGKTSFACCLAKLLKTKAWSVSSMADDQDSDRRVSLMATVALAERKPGSIVLVDEAERILDTGMERDGSSAKAWLNELLERKNLRIIWITNHVEHLDQAVRRRFSYSIHFESPGMGEAEILWEIVAKRERVLKKLPAETRKHFAKTWPVPIATMELAVRQAKQIAGKDDFAACVERVLKAQVVLRNDGLRPVVKSANCSDYNPAAICVSRPVEGIVRQVTRLAKKMGAKDRGMGGILFYGPPGTGKTAFAGYLAEQAGMECLRVQASDLIDKYVGESEKNIRMFFEKASRERSLLLFDEADSFISAREGANHTWEVSMVNEFLTNLENFDGICVCTTNFRKVLDTASMRRFSMKVEFCHAKPQQIRELYKSILAPLAAGKMDEALLERLCANKCLAPGDFKAVRAQFFLLDPEEVSHEDLVRALEHEQALKLGGDGKTVGF